MDTQVIHIDLQPTFSNHVSEDVVHECLKCRRCVTKSKEHDSGFVKAKWGDECGLPLVFFVDLDVVIPPLDVKLGK